MGSGARYKVLIIISLPPPQVSKPILGSLVCFHIMYLNSPRQQEVPTVVLRAMALVRSSTQPASPSRKKDQQKSFLIETNNETRQNLQTKRGRNVDPDSVVTELYETSKRTPQVQPARTLQPPPGFQPKQEVYTVHTDATEQEPHSTQSHLTNLVRVIGHKHDSTGQLKYMITYGILGNKRTVEVNPQFVHEAPSTHKIGTIQGNSSFENLH